MLALLDECLGHGRHFRDGAIQPQRGVDGVRQQIAGDAASGNRDIQTPQSFATLRQVRRDGPILKEFRAVVEDAAEAAFVDQMLEQHHGRHAAVVVPDHVGDFGGFHRLRHRGGFRRIAPERLFAQHHFAGLRGGDGDFRVRVVGAGDVDQVDVLAVHQLAPVGFDRLISPVFGEGFRALRDCARREL